MDYSNHIVNSITNAIKKERVFTLSLEQNFEYIISRHISIGDDFILYEIDLLQYKSNIQKQILLNNICAIDFQKLTWRCLILTVSKLSWDVKQQNKQTNFPPKRTCTDACTQYCWHRSGLPRYGDVQSWYL